jgi:DNA primase
VLGFGGRTLKSDKNIAKYFNSPESLIYNKSKILYGIHFAKNAIIKNDLCYLVEGYTDVISLFQSGVENVVASSGTSLTLEQIKLVKRYTKNITVLYDGDSAGIKASFRGIDLILAEGMNVKVVLFPDGDDPDSYSKKVSEDELVDYLNAEAKNFITFKSAILLEDSGNDPIKRAELIKGILQSIAVVPDAISRTLFLKECAGLFEMEEHILTGELNKLRIENARKEQGGAEIQPIRNKTIHNQSLETETGLEESSLLEAAERELMRVMILYGTYILEVEHSDGENVSMPVETSIIELIIHELEKDDITFQNKTFREIYELFCEGVQESKLYSSSFFLRSENPEVVSFMADVVSEKYALSDNWFNRYRVEVKTEQEKLLLATLKAIYQLKSNFLESQIRKLDAQLKEMNDSESFEEITGLLVQKNQFKKVKRLIEKELGRL